MTDFELSQLYLLLTQTTFSNETKYLINQVGLVHAKNEKNSTFHLSKDEDLWTFFKPHILEHSSPEFNLLTENNTSQELKFKIQNKDGKLHYFRAIIAGLHNTPDSLFLVQIQDISKEVFLEAQLSKQSLKMEGEMILRTKEIMHTANIINSQGGYLINFLRGLRHDLVSPITQLSDIIEYFKKTEDPAKKIKASQLIDNCLSKLTNTARGFSDFVDIHFLADEQKEICTINHVINDNLLLLNQEVQKGDIEIINECDDNLQIHFNKRELSSILYNLLSNAIKFRRNDVPSKIIIASEKSKGTIKLSIQDNGIGMDLKKHGKLLFTPFTRLNSKFPGAGIGLSLVKNIMDKCNSKISIESTPHIGTKISLEFY